MPDLARFRPIAYAVFLALMLSVGWSPPVALGQSPAGDIVQWGVYGPFPQPTPTPLQDPGALLGKTVTAMDIGPTACALAGGQIYCWGGGTNAFFPGSGSTAPVLLPFQAFAGKVVSQLSLGTEMVCAVVDGAALCWGKGPLGNGEFSSPSPVPVTQAGDLAGKPVSSVAVADQMACLIAEGRLYCWGYSGIGGGIAIPQAVDPAGVLAGKAVSMVSVSPSGSVCVIADGRAYCTNGSLTFTPVVSDALTDKVVTAIAVGDTHSCLVAQGQPYCWGKNSRGQLGNGVAVDSTMPVPVYTGGALGSTSVQSVTVGRDHSCALAQGTIACWGDNTLGQLGVGQQLGDKDYSPVPLGAATGHLVVAGATETCSAAAQTVSCWGWGVTKLERRGEPYPLGIQARQVEGSCAIIKGRVNCWTEPSGPTGSVRPLPVKGLPSGRVSGLSAGAWHTCAVVSGKAYCWGINSYGQLGDGTRKASVAAVRVVSKGAWAQRRVTAISAGFSHTCAVAAGKAYCWGTGSLGTASAKRSTKPLLVAIPGKRVTGISAGAQQLEFDDPNDESEQFTGLTDTCAVAGARLYCWGWNTHGQLGTGNTRSSATPKLVASGGLSGLKVQAVSMDPTNSYSPRTCAIAGGRAFCWGRDLGPRPMRVKGLPDTRVRQIAVGPWRICGLTRGDVWCGPGLAGGSTTPEQLDFSPLGRGAVVQLSSRADRAVWRS